MRETFLSGRDRRNDVDIFVEIPSEKHIEIIRSNMHSDGVVNVRKRRSVTSKKDHHVFRLSSQHNGIGHVFRKRDGKEYSNIFSCCRYYRGVC